MADSTEIRLPLSVNLDVDGQKITSVAAPTEATDAANKAYVDAETIRRYPPTLTGGNTFVLSRGDVVYFQLVSTGGKGFWIFDGADRNGEDAPESVTITSANLTNYTPGFSSIDADHWRAISIIEENELPDLTDASLNLQYPQLTIVYSRVATGNNPPGFYQRANVDDTIWTPLAGEGANDNSRIVLNGADVTVAEDSFRISPASGQIQLRSNNSYILGSIEVADRFVIAADATSPVRFDLTQLATGESGGLAITRNPEGLDPVPVTITSEEGIAESGDTVAVRFEFTRVNANPLPVDVLYRPRYRVVMPQDPSVGDVVILKKIGDAHPIIKGAPDQPNNAPRVLIAGNSETGTMEELILEDNEEVHLTFLGTTQGWWRTRNPIVRFVDGTADNPLSLELSAPIAGDLVWIEPASGSHVNGLNRGLARFNGTEWVSGSRSLVNGGVQMDNFMAQPQTMYQLQNFNNNSVTLLNGNEVGDFIFIDGTQVSAAPGYTVAGTGVDLIGQQSNTLTFEWNGAAWIELDDVEQLSGTQIVNLINAGTTSGQIAAPRISSDVARTSSQAIQVSGTTPSLANGVTAAALRTLIGSASGGGHNIRIPNAAGTLTAAAENIDFTNAGNVDMSSVTVGDTTRVVANVSDLVVTQPGGAAPTENSLIQVDTNGNYAYVTAGSHANVPTFGTFAFSGQDNLEPESPGQTVNFAAGGNITYTADNNLKRLTISDPGSYADDNAGGYAVAGNFAVNGPILTFPGGTFHAGTAGGFVNEDINLNHDQQLTEIRFDGVRNSNNDAGFIYSLGAITGVPSGWTVNVADGQPFSTTARQNINISIPGGLLNPPSNQPGTHRITVAVTYRPIGTTADHNVQTVQDIVVTINRVEEDLLLFYSSNGSVTETPSDFADQATPRPGTINAVIPTDGDYVYVIVDRDITSVAMADPATPQLQVLMEQTASGVGTENRRIYRSRIRLGAGSHTISLIYG